METNKTAQEINRIERELEAKGEPPFQLPKSGSGNGDEAGERPNHDHLEKNYQLSRRHNSAQGRSEGLLAF